MTYREALETLNRMMTAGSSPQAIALHICTLPDAIRAAVSSKVSAHAALKTFGRQVQMALRDVTAAKPKTGRKEPNDGNPVYPALPSVNKFRKLAGNRELTAEETKAYGRSVLEGIRALQRQEIMRGTPKLPSAKYETGADVLKRIAAENKAAFARDCQSDRTARSDAAIIAEYEHVMSLKRAAQAANAAQPETANVMTFTKPAKPAPDHSARMRKAWETRRANAAKRAA
jgi:hypothetical protein